MLSHVRNLGLAVFSVFSVHVFAESLQIPTLERDRKLFNRLNSWQDFDPRGMGIHISGALAKKIWDETLKNRYPLPVSSKGPKFRILSDKKSVFFHCFQGINQDDSETYYCLIIAPKINAVENPHALEFRLDDLTHKENYVRLTEKIPEKKDEAGTLLTDEASTKIEGVRFLADEARWLFQEHLAKVSAETYYQDFNTPVSRKESDDMTCRHLIEFQQPSYYCDFTKVRKVDFQGKKTGFRVDYDAGTVSDLPTP
jgi:hypothetical protein